MDWKTCVLVIVMVVSVDSDCSSGLQGCIETYQQAYNSAQNNATKCSVTDAYVKCLFSQPGCKVDPAQRQKVIDTNKGSLVGLNCSFTIEELIQRYGQSNSSGQRLPINIILIFIASVSFHILKS